ncbi:MAG: hypothetical protein ACR2NC_00675 [Thermodesulfobacteriota bacterium]
MPNNLIKPAIQVLYNFTDTTQGVDKAEILRIFGISKNYKPEEMLEMLLENSYLSSPDDNGLYFITQSGLDLIRA